MKSGDFNTLKILTSLSLLIVWAIIAGWLLSYPYSVSHDDAFFFSNALHRFSVLEFSPHFPGYPGFIWLGRLANLVSSSPAAAVINVSLFATLLIPWSIYLSARALMVPFEISAVASLCVMLVPVFPFVALSGMSDGVGLLFLMLGFVEHLQQKWLISGVFFGFAALCRPYLLPLIVFYYFVGFVFLIYFSRKSEWLDWGASRLSSDIKPTISGGVTGFFCSLLSCGLVGSIGLLFLFAHDGSAYITEGVRFISGHFSLWSANNTQVTWFHSLNQLFGHWVVFVLFSLVACGGVKRYPEVVLTYLFAAALLFGTQNPANPRHVMPVITIGLLAMMLAFSSVGCATEKNRRFRRRLGLLVFSMIAIGFMFQTVRGVQQEVRLSPVDQLVQFFEKQAPNQLILTNHGVEYLKTRMPEQRVVDTYYRDQWLLLLRREGGWRISTTKLDDHLELEKKLLPRFSGEPILWLYKYN